MDVYLDNMLSEKWEVGGQGGMTLKPLSLILCCPQEAIKVILLLVTLTS